VKLVGSLAGSPARGERPGTATVDPQREITDSGYVLGAARW